MFEEEKKQTQLEVRKEEKAETTKTPEKSKKPAPAEQSEKAEKPEKSEKPAKAEKAKEEKPTEGQKVGGKKISRMTLKEVEAGLKMAQQKMGGFQSRFARDLLARKKELTRQ